MLPSSTRQTITLSADRAPYLALCAPWAALGTLWAVVFVQNPNSSTVQGVVACVAILLGMVVWVAALQIRMGADAITLRTLFGGWRRMPYEGIRQIQVYIGQRNRFYPGVLIQIVGLDGGLLEIPIKSFSIADLQALIATLRERAPKAELDELSVDLGRGELKRIKGLIVLGFFEYLAWLVLASFTAAVFVGLYRWLA